MGKSRLISSVKIRADDWPSSPAWWVEGHPGGCQGTAVVSLCGHFRRVVTHGGSRLGYGGTIHGMMTAWNKRRKRGEKQWESSVHLSLPCWPWGNSFPSCCCTVRVQGNHVTMLWTLPPPNQEPKQFSLFNLFLLGLLLGQCEKKVPLGDRSTRIDKKGWIGGSEIQWRDLKGKKSFVRYPPSYKTYLLTHLGQTWASVSLYN